MKPLLQFAGAVALLAIAAFFCVLAHVTAQLPRKVDAIQADVNNHALFLRAEAAKQIEEARKDVLVRSERQVAGSRKDMINWAEHIAEIVNIRTGEALATVHTGMALANGQINGIREDVKPVLATSAAAVKDANDSWDDLYYDVKASVESFTVASRQVAEASTAVSKALPAMTESSVETSEQFAGIAADVHTFTSRFVGPKTKKQKAWAAMQTLLMIGVRAF